MSDSALQPGSILEDRFEIVEVLGHGGFGVAYLAKDRKRSDQCVVKELHPIGSTRSAGGILELPGDEAWAARLKRRFIDEARISSGLRARGILPVRAAFSALGTSFFATDYVEDAQTLDQKLDQSSRLSNEEASTLFRDLLETLEAVHGAGVLHRDIKPSNILVGPKATYLIDFGAAREWHADRTQDHSIVFTPEFTPPEQLAERARRGPATDLFALCATMYRALAGAPPASAAARASGVPYVSVAEIAPNVTDRLREAIDFGLRLKFAERPQSAELLLRVLDGETAEDQSDDAVFSFDARAKRLYSFHFQKRQCPACQTGILEQPRPLKSKQCPVCHAGFIRLRKIDPRLCPHCRQGALIERENKFPAAICPICCADVLEKRKKGLFKAVEYVECPDCESTFWPDGGAWRIEMVRGKSAPAETQRVLSSEDWRIESGRSYKFWLCSGCEAQYDHLDDGRRRQMIPFRVGKYDALFPDEWACVAAGLPPHSGNAECDSCRADYFVDGDRVTLLVYDEDPFEIGERIQGRLLEWESLRWLGVGKESPRDGFVCADCRTELDIVGDELDLVSTDNGHLLDMAEKPRSIEDWVRIGQNLPSKTEEAQFEADFDAALREAYREGRIGPDFPKRKELIWQGAAVQGEFENDRFEPGAESQLTITTEEITFGGLLKKRRYPFDEIRSISRQDDVLGFHFDDDVVCFELDQLEISFGLESGNRKIDITAEDVEYRLNLELETRR